MSTHKYRDLSTGASEMGAGFQFEFYCEQCSETWVSPFRPYRVGQVSGLLQRFAFVFSGLSTAGRATGGLADAGARRAKEEALAAAAIEADRRFRACPSCGQQVCEHCWSGGAERCRECASPGGAGSAASGGRAPGGAARETACPNCQAPTQGGRFCAECGFDMASTHKSCPGCSATVPRQARFCPDCGHGF